jgi:divalent metal cation (Fe/Co/Zn/Cd) transporter
MKHNNPRQIHDQSRDKLLHIAFILSLITIIYNIFEGLISIFFGITDDTLALLGFGVDSFVEVISGLGIAHMLLRMKLSGTEKSDRFERTALRITGFSFYILTAGLVIGSVINIAQNNKPETTLAGIIISVISIITMYILMRYKLHVGKKMDSNAVIADAHSTMTCFYLSIILLISSLLYELFHIAYIDIMGSLGIAYFAYKEGKEAFENAAKVTT